MTVLAVCSDPARDPLDAALLTGSRIGKRSRACHPADPDDPGVQSNPICVARLAIV
jgi:hypothetical protein